MSVEPYTIAFVDDEPDVALPEYEEALLPLEATFSVHRPPQKHDEWGPFIEGLEAADLILLDHNLLKHVAYDGGMLSVRLRSRFPTTPVVLVTRPRISESVPPDELAESDFRTPGAAQVVDEVLYKNELADRHETIRGLIDGYRTLRSSLKQGASLHTLEKLLGANEREMRELRTAGLELSTMDDRKAIWEPHVLVVWLRHTLQRYPGPLLNKRHVAARVGLTLGAFSTENVRGLFEDVLYRGVFEDSSHPRWWRSRLLATAERFVEDNLGVDSRRLSLSFPDACSKAGFDGLEVALCEWDGTPGVDTVCYVSSNPVKLENSLAYRPDGRPPGMDEARVSFRSIKERNDYDERLFGLAGQQEVERIQSDLTDPLANHEA